MIKVDWDYVYACFVAINKHGLMRDAWESIKPMHAIFWDSANIYPVIVGPRAGSTSPHR